MFGFVGLIIPLLTLTVIGIWAVRALKKKAHGHSLEMEWYLKVALSKEDFVSQFYFLLSVLFLGVAMFSFNRSLSNPFSWQTIILAGSLVGLFFAYYFKALYCLVVSLIGVMFWWVVQMGEQADKLKTNSVFILSGLVFVAIIYYIIGRLHEVDQRYKRFALAFSLIGLTAVIAIMFFASFQQGLEVIESMAKGESIFGSPLVIFSLLFLFLMFLVLTFYGLFKRRITFYEFLFAFFTVLIFILLTIVSPEDFFTKNTYGYLSQQLSSVGVVWALVFNIALLFQILGVIFFGYNQKEKWLINFGTLLLFIFIISKYFDWFFSFLDKSIFFIGAGLLLFIVGWFMERGRKKMITNINVQIN